MLINWSWLSEVCELLVDSHLTRPKIVWGIHICNLPTFLAVCSVNLIFLLILNQPSVVLFLLHVLSALLVCSVTLDTPWVKQKTWTTLATRWDIVLPWPFFLYSIVDKSLPIYSSIHRSVFYWSLHLCHIELLLPDFLVHVFLACPFMSGCFHRLYILPQIIMPSPLQQSF